MSFAYLVYASAWFKLHHPAAFCAALLNAQPMGFYSPHSLVQDARRHGVVVRTPDINASGAGATLEPCEDSEGGLAVRLGVGSVRTHRRRPGRADRRRPPLRRHGGRRPPQRPDPRPARGPGHRRVRSSAVRRPIADGGPMRAESRTWPARHGRREARAAVAAAQSRPDRLAGIVTGAEAPALPGHGRPGDGDRRPVGHRRVARRPPDPVRARRARPARGDHGGRAAGRRGRTDRVLVGGVVTHRQRPATASGITFLNLEDETGLVNVIVSKGCWMRHRRVARTSPALLIRGKLEKVEGVTNVVAERISLLPLPSRLRSRDFH